MSTSPKPQLNLNAGFGALVVTSPNIEVELTDDGRVVVHKGTVEETTLSAQAEFKKALKTGDVITDGPNKGWIYCEGENVKPFLVAPADMGLQFTWSDAIALAETHGAMLAWRSQLQAMFNAREAGAFNGTFNIASTARQSWYWSQAVYDDERAWSAEFSTGLQYVDPKYVAQNVRLVRPYAPV